MMTVILLITDFTQVIEDHMCLCVCQTVSFPVYLKSDLSAPWNLESGSFALHAEHYVQ